MGKPDRDRLQGQFLEDGRLICVLGHSFLERNNCWLKLFLFRSSAGVIPVNHPIVEIEQCQYRGYKGAGKRKTDICIQRDTDARQMGGV